MALDSDLDVRATTRLGVGALVVAGLLLAVTALLATVGGENLSSRLTSRAVGTIESVRGEHDDVVTVSWTDSTGGAHRDDFLPSGEVEDIGAPFDVRYDPTNPYGRVVADEPEQVAPPGQEGVWAALAVLALVGVWTAAWAVRGWRNAAALGAAAAPAHPMTMVVASQTSGGAKRCVAVLVGPDVDLPTPFVRAPPGVPPVARRRGGRRPGGQR